MWKVLIADDEPKIRRGLGSLFERFDETFEVVGEAGDGEVALEKAIELEPDLLMVDIRMPFLSGLAFIERLEKVLPGRIVIIVSGHDEFEYAQAAIKLKVFDYLLKPVSIDAFSSVIARARDELGSRNEAARYIAQAREQVERNLPMLRESFFKDWICSGLSRSEVEEGLSFLGMALGSPAMLFAARFSERTESLSPGYSHRLEQVALRTVLEEALPREDTFLFEDDADMVLAISPAMSETELAQAMGDIERRIGERSLRPPQLAARPLLDPLSSLVEIHEELSAEFAGGDRCDAVVIMARNYIDGRIGDPGLSLEETAEALRISSGYLSRLLKREIGASFIEYLTRQRIKRAMEIMNDPAVRVCEAAERSGYRSQHYFSRAFRKVTGYSPSEFRKGGAE